MPGREQRSANARRSNDDTLRIAKLARFDLNKQ
jgi:hypothetical protein